MPVKNPKPMHPGQVLNAVRKITALQLARVINMSLNDTKDLLDGDVPINKTIARKLEKITGISTSTWLKMQQEYDKVTNDRFL